MVRSAARPSPSASLLFLSRFFNLVRLFYITDESATLSGPDASYPLEKSVGYETSQTNTTTRSVGSFGAGRFEVVSLKLKPPYFGLFPTLVILANFGLWFLVTNGRPLPFCVQCPRGRQFFFGGPPRTAFC
jgi:hypothetical protein